MISHVVLTVALFINPVVPSDITPASAVMQVEALDMRGYEPSLYKGKWYDPKWEPTRKCIMRRESHFNYRAANKSSSARGAYQFLDSQWRESLTYMLLPEHKQMRDEIIALRDIPINQWNRYWQDAAFYTAWRHGEGAKHWHYKGSLGC